MAEHDDGAEAEPPAFCQPCARQGRADARALMLRSNRHRGEARDPQSRMAGQ
jgi:hypothetical protein